MPLNFAKGRDLSPAPQTRPDGTTTTPTSATNTQQGALNVLATSSALQNPNLATGQQSTSVLGSYTYDSGFFPGIPTEQSQLTSQIAAAAQKRFADEQTAIEDTFKQRSETITKSVNQWITVKASINNAKASVTQAETSMKKVTDALLSLRGVVSNAAKDAKFNTKSFNANLATINGEADRLGKSLNLVGSINRVDFTRNEVEYRNNLTTGVSTLNGTYIGNDFRIEATDGSVWQPNLRAG